jgi:hypothetical protein
VKRKMNSGGMAIRKLNATDAALSFNPICCVCFMKKTTTSYKGIPSKPGRITFFDQSMIGRTGQLSMMILCSLIIVD